MLVVEVKCVGGGGMVKCIGGGGEVCWWWRWRGVVKRDEGWKDMMGNEMMDE